MGSARVKQDKMEKMLGLFSAGMLLVLSAGFSTTYATPEHEMRNNEKEEPNCFLCQIVVVSVEMAIISNNVTMDHIVESVGYVCDTLGEEDSSIVASCHAMVEEYLEIIIDMIVVQLMQPFEVCSTLNICP